MAKYYFHISSSEPFKDGEGLDLPNDDAAWLEAKRLVRDIEASLAPGDTWQLDVLDGDGAVFAISLNSKRLR